MKLKELICKIVMVLCLFGLFEVGANSKVYADEQNIVNFTSFGKWVSCEGERKITYKVVPKKSGVYNIALNCGGGAELLYYSAYGTLYNSDKEFIGCIYDVNDDKEIGNKFYLCKGKTYYVVIEKSYYNKNFNDDEKVNASIKISYYKDYKVGEVSEKVDIDGRDINNGGALYDSEKHILELNNYTGEDGIEIHSSYDFMADKKDDPNFLNFTIKISGTNTINLNPGQISFITIFGKGNFNIIGDGTLYLNYIVNDLGRNGFICGDGCNINIDGPTIVVDEANSSIIDTGYLNDNMGRFTFKSGAIIIKKYYNYEDEICSVIDAASVVMTGGVIRVHYVKEGSWKIEKSYGTFYVYGNMNVTGGNIILTGNLSLILKVKPVESFGRLSEKTNKAILAGFRIKVSELDIKLEKYKYKYDGKAKTPKVYINGLEEGTDYTVTYEDNIKAGTAKVIVRGAGVFWATKKINFKIFDGMDENGSYDGIHGEKISGLLTDGKFIYKVTKDGTLDGKTVGKVIVVGLKKKSLKKVSIKSILRVNGVKYKVTAIGKKAFKKGKKLKSIVIGKNVSKIGKRAFAGCKKLKSIKIKSKKIKKFVKGTFKGVKKTCVIKVPKAKKKVYAKKIKKAGFKGIIK